MKNVLAEIQTKNVLAEAAIALPTDLSSAIIVGQIPQMNIKDHTIWAVILDVFRLLEIYVYYDLFTNVIMVFKINPT